MKNLFLLLLLAGIATGFTARGQDDDLDAPVPPPPGAPPVAPPSLVRTNRANRFPDQAPPIPSVTPSAPGGRALPGRGAIPIAVPAPAAPAPAAANGVAGPADVIMPPAANFGALAPEALMPKGSITRFQSAPLEQILQTYALVTGRIILRPNVLPAANITLDASQLELTKAEAIQAMDSVLSLNGITMINVGEKFVTAVPSTQALQEGAAFSEVDPADLPEAGQFVTKIVQLRYASPSEVQPLIVGFSKMQNGIVPIESTQTLVLRDNAANVKRMMEIIAKVDVEVESDYKLEVIPIKYGMVQDIYSTMSSIIGGGGGAGGAFGGQATGATGTRGTTGRGGTGNSMRSSTSSVAFQRNNTGQNRTGIQGGAGQINQPGVTPGASFNQRLQGVMNNMTGRGGTQMLGPDTRIVPDERSNSLIVFASKTDLGIITNMVAKVDRLLAQVLIEAVIMDVQLTGELEYGVSSYLADQSGKYNQQGIMNPGGVLSSLTNLAGGSAKDGFTYFGNYNDQVKFVIKALASNGRGEILATPRVQTSHAKAANFSVGQTVPYVTGTFSGGFGGVPSTSYSQLDVSTELNVTPYITPDGLVVMDIAQNIEEITGFKTFANVGELPLTVRRTASATVSVQDNDTIILGGYIRNTRNRNRSGVPLLKDIPVLGSLFSNTTDSKSRSELVVFIKPTVLQTPRDAALLAGRERERLPGIRHMENDMETEMKKLSDKVDKDTGANKKK